MHESSHYAPNYSQVAIINKIFPCDVVAVQQKDKLTIAILKQEMTNYFKVLFLALSPTCCYYSLDCVVTCSVVVNPCKQLATG